MQGPPQHRVLSSAPQCSASGAGVPRWEQCLGGGDDTREQQALPWPEEPLQQLHGARYGGGGEGALSGGLTGGGWPWPGPVTPHSALPAWLCPENAACAPDGPGLVQCLCDSPFHGYKCLREVSAYRTGPPLPTPPPARARAAWAGGGWGQRHSLLLPRRGHSLCCFSVGSWEPSPCPCPSCCGAPSAGKPRPPERGGCACASVSAEARLGGLWVLGGLCPEGLCALASGSPCVSWD